MTRPALRTMLCLLLAAFSPAHARTMPYLAPGVLSQAASLLPLPPVAGSLAQMQDGAIFLANRPLKQNHPERWRQVREDVLLDPGQMLQSFGPALGFSPDRAALPGLFRLLDRTTADARLLLITARPKSGRVRPFHQNHLPICVSRFTTTADDTLSYPSGEALAGWSTALILSELSPGHSGAILARGRAIGESGVVCGVHWSSDVSGGMQLAAALVAVLHSSAAFRADLALGGREIARTK